MDESIRDFYFLPSFPGRFLYIHSAFFDAYLFLLFRFFLQQSLSFYPSSSSPMASVYSCVGCGANLNLSTINLFPSDFYFEAGNKGTLSFARVDESKLRFEKEDKIRPFFESLDYWGIQRKRTKIKCSSCGCLVGYVYDDGPPLTDSLGQFNMGPSQVIPRAPRYRFKTKALKIVAET